MASMLKAFSAERGAASAPPTAPSPAAAVSARPTVAISAAASAAAAERKPAAQVEMPATTLAWGCRPSSTASRVPSAQSVHYHHHRGGATAWTRSAAHLSGPAPRSAGLDAPPLQPR